MKIDLNVLLKDFNDTVLTFVKKQGEPAERFSLKQACVNALLANNDEVKVSGTEKFNRYELAKKIKDSKGVVDLTVEELSLLKTLIGDSYTTLIAGQCWNLLENPVK